MRQTEERDFRKHDLTSKVDIGRELQSVNLIGNVGNAITDQGRRQGA